MGNHGNSIVLSGANRNQHNFVSETIQLVKIDTLVGLSEQADKLSVQGRGPGGAAVHVHVWKLDCQGMELPALRGARALLAAQRVDSMFIEFDTGMTRMAGYNIVDLMKYLDELHYVMFYEREKIAQRIDPKDFESFAVICNAALDVVVVSTPFLAAVGDAAVKKLMEYPKEQLGTWLMSSDKQRIPGLDY